MASARARRAAAPPGSLSATSAKCSESAASAFVFITCTVIPRTTSDALATPLVSRRLALVLGIPRPLELDGELLAARFLNPAAGQHVHPVRHDVVQEALVVRDDEHGAVFRPQRIDAVGDDAHGVDVEPAVGLVEHGER